MELREVPEPEPERNEAVVEVHAFSLNRGELRSFRNNEEGWVPGQDVAGVVLSQAQWKRPTDRHARRGADG